MTVEGLPNAIAKLRNVARCGDLDLQARPLQRRRTECLEGEELAARLLHGGRLGLGSEVASRVIGRRRDELAVHAQRQVRRKLLRQVAEVAVGDWGEQRKGAHLLVLFVE